MPFLASSVSSGPDRGKSLALAFVAAATVGVCTVIKKNSKNDSHDIAHK